MLFPRYLIFEFYVKSIFFHPILNGYGYEFFTKLEPLKTGLLNQY